jgi:iron complex transport system substrate-binding protein
VRPTDVLVAALVLLLGTAAAAVPRRVVSMNPCADAILAEVAAPGQIAALSHWSADPAATSMDAARARRIGVHFGTAEEVLRLSPDLVIAGAHTPAATRAVFARMGIPVVLVGVPASVAQSHAEVRAIAAAVGRPAAGEALIARTEAALAAAATPAPPLPTLLRTPAGVVPGKGTLVDDVMARVGLANAAAPLGLASWDVLPLETLVQHPPRLLLADPRAPRHPALRALAPRLSVAPFDMRLINCGGPTIARLAPALATARVAATGR